jgi:pimeloyl-ACP methyl ester carboxylesterase
MRDMTNFAANVTLKFCGKNRCNAADVPWVLVGGSYSGALAAWTSLKEPGVFHAYHASSAVVQTIGDFWSYFVPVAEMLQPNCSSDIRAVVQYVDYVFGQGNQEDIATLKARFGLEGLDAADFAWVLADPLLDWQGDQEATIAFCDFLETNGNTTRALLNNGQGVGLKSALESYAAWIRANSGCGAYGASCNTYTTKRNWADPTPNDDRPWQW